MREPLDRERLERFMEAIARESSERCSVYLVGGASAVLEGWRSGTIDVDLAIVPEVDSIYRAIPRLKEQLAINVELAAPHDFLPPLPNWQERSPFIENRGLVDFHHYDFRAQALAKIERGHARDLRDAREMIRRELVTREELREAFDQMEPLLYRYPAIDRDSFASAVERFLDEPD